MRHANIVKLIGIAFTAEGNPVIVTEFLPNGSLKNYLEGNVRRRKQLFKSSESFRSQQTSHGDGDCGGHAISTQFQYSSSGLSDAKLHVSLRFLIKFRGFPRATRSKSPILAFHVKCRQTTAAKIARSTRSRRHATCRFVGWHPNSSFFPRYNIFFSVSQK